MPAAKFEYPKQKTPANPANLALGEASQIAMNDMPNAPYKWSGFGKKLKDLWQRFEVCAVCLQGKEGINWKDPPSVPSDMP